MEHLFFKEILNQNGQYGLSYFDNPQANIDSIVKNLLEFININNIKNANEIIIDSY